MDTVKIDARDVNFWYGDFHALKGISMEIEEKSVVAFIGPSGCGKSTFLRLFNRMNDLIPATRLEGEIRIDGHSIKEEPLACKKEIAYIPDNPDLYEYMTGIQYLNFIADIFGVSAEERRERIQKYGDLFELTGDLAQPISAYSHGMKQKLAIIAALVHQPKLIIMDEPFVGLDPKASHLLKTIMREICDSGSAIFK